MIYSVGGDNLYGNRAHFKKPWFQVLTMFVGMSICIVLDSVKRRHHHHSRHTSKKDRKEHIAGDDTHDEGTPLLASNGHENSHAHRYHRRTAAQKHVTSLWLLQVPTLLDMIATACGTTGLLFTTVSVYQMLRGAQLVFVAILSVVFLKRRLNVMNYVGICLCTMGITLVGLANVYNEDEGHGKRQTLFGVLIILLGQLLQGTQSVVEEYFMKNLQMSSVKVVAWEGLFGVMHCVVWVLPLLYFLPGFDHGHWEDSLDSLYMITHSSSIVLIMFADMTMMLFYNLCGMIVTESLSAVHRVIIETLRTICVWVIDVFLFYFVTNGGFGEPWTKYSYLQLAGFGFLVMGTLTYNAEQIWVEYQAAKEIAELKEVAAIAKATVPGTADYSPHDIMEAGQVLRGKEKKYGALGEEGVGSEEEEDENLSAEESDGDSVYAGSLYGNPFGSASHGSFLLSPTPTITASSPFLRHRNSSGHSVP